MKTFLSDLWVFLTGHTDHPIYRRELAGWSYLRIWRSLRKGCLLLMVALSVATMSCCGLLMLPILLEDPGSWFAWVTSIVLGGLYISMEVIHWVMGLAATVLTATALSAEVEARTYRLLRVTPIPARQIALAKFGAAFWQLRIPLAFVTIVRAFMMISLAILLSLVILLTDTRSEAAEFLSSQFSTFPTVIELAAGLSVLGIVWLMATYYLLKPTLNVVLFAAVGLFASSLARTRVAGLFGGAGLRVVLWVISYVAGQFTGIIFQIFVAPLAFWSASPAWLENILATEPGQRVYLKMIE